MTGFALVAGLALFGCDDHGASQDAPLEIDVDATAMADAQIEADAQADDAGAGGEGGQGPDAGEVDAGGEGGEGGEGGGEPPAFECDAPVATTVDVVDLGEVVVDGASEAFTLELPEDVISVTLSAVELTDSAFVGVGLFEGPDGQILISEDPPGGILPNAQFAALFPGPFSSPNRFAVAATGVGSMLAPNNPGVDVTPGTWRVRLLAANQSGRPAETTVQVTALIKRAAEPPNCGALDVHLYFTGARDWTAASAPDDPDFQRALARMRAFYAVIGIELGVITYDDLPDGEQFLSADAVGGPNSTLHDLYSRCAYDSGVCLFFVERLTSPFGGGGGGGIGGVAGGTPGPTLQAGTPRSGVAVATSIAPDPESIGHVMGHETGHYLGLYHTQEFIGFTDQIDDTPTGAAGQSNLMYPTVTPEDAALSPGQGFVLLRNASVYVPEESK